MGVRPCHQCFEGRGGGYDGSDALGCLRRMTEKGRAAERASAFWLLEGLPVLGEHQHPLNQQLTQHGELLSGQQLVAVGAFQFEGQVGGHGVERGESFAGLDQEGFAGNVWRECEEVGGGGIGGDLFHDEAPTLFKELPPPAVKQNRWQLYAG